MEKKMFLVAILLHFFCMKLCATGEFDVSGDGKHNRNVLKVHVWIKVPDNFQSKANLSSGGHVAFELDHQYFFNKNRIQDIEKWVLPYKLIRLNEYWGTSEEVGCARERFNFPFMSFWKDSSKNVLMKRSEGRLLGQPNLTLCLELNGGVGEKGTLGIKNVYLAFLESLKSGGSMYSEPMNWFDYFITQARSNVRLTRVLPGSGKEIKGFHELYVQFFRNLLLPPTTYAQQVEADTEKVKIKAESDVFVPPLLIPTDLQKAEADGEKAKIKAEEDEIAKEAKEEQDKKKKINDLLKKKGDLECELKKQFDEYNSIEARFVSRENAWVTVLAGGGACASVLVGFYLKGNRWEFWQELAVSGSIFGCAGIFLLKSVSDYSSRRNASVVSAMLGYEDKSEQQVRLAAKQKLIRDGLSDAPGLESFLSAVGNNKITCLFGLATSAALIHGLSVIKPDVQTLRGLFNFT